MSLFLEVVPVERAVEVVRSIAPEIGTERVDLTAALHRVLGSEVRAPHDLPGFDRSVVDGYAVVASDTTGASEALPAMLTLRGRVEMGQAPPGTVEPGACWYIPTGGVLPPGADAVAMIEYSEAVGDEVLVGRAVAPGENVLSHDEDYAADTVILSTGRRITPQDMGVLASAGVTSVDVVRRPRIGIISTGNEVVPAETAPAPGQVRDANTYLCSGFAQEHGCDTQTYGIVRDDPALLRPVLERAVSECDCVLISGGSSKDVRDMTAGVIGELGEVLVHGIAVAPGKPTIIGRVRTTPVIGLPGHPASAYIVLFAVVRHLIATINGAETPFRLARMPLAANIPSAKGREDYVRVAVVDRAAHPVFGKSGLLNTLVRSDGFVVVPAGREGLETGEETEVILW
ncbi:molybdopterin molybdotransferase MoeA [Methanofollis fontis]|uniref:Molybdopterin molybdenumtransferase MoeA n=1 Tax=Methanofollis fontis TaxID=2052832 RepID=A0A483CKP0_9EURY|nr:gephyrin-like molybdotransferase Glp [Methanofollis fontis]TAJ43462.1 molybdopterin molybdenumtransferase MoeA [Methanofollis fontis]